VVVKPSLVLLEILSVAGLLLMNKKGQKLGRLPLAKWETKPNYIEKPCLLKAIKEPQSGIFSCFRTMGYDLKLLISVQNLPGFWGKQR